MPSDRVELVEHDPTWAELFESERVALAPVFDGQRGSAAREAGRGGGLGEPGGSPSSLVSIEHVGSTSVPGLCAKPIVDVLVGLRELRLTDDQVEGMARLGYDYLGEHGLARTALLPQGAPDASCPRRRARRRALGAADHIPGRPPRRRGRAPALRRVQAPARGPGPSPRDLFRAEDAVHPRGRGSGPRAGRLTIRRSVAAAAGSAITIPARIAAQPAKPRAPSRSPASR